MADLLSQFISDENSICREERQYALYLYNILQAYHAGNREEPIISIVKEIFAGKTVENYEFVIDNVFYEATFMRDLFEYNRRLHFVKDAVNNDADNIYRVKDPDVLAYEKIRKVKEKDGKEYNFEAISFNYKLFDYLSKNKKWLYYEDGKSDCELVEKMINEAELQVRGLDKEYHIGQYKKSKKDDDKELNKKDKNSVIEDMKYMMNAKPDIAIIYREGVGETKKLLFLECKFESGESNYGKREQTEIQYMIADFLCNETLLDRYGNKIKFGCEVSSLMTKKNENNVKKRKSLKVAFFRYNNNCIRADVKIGIKDLIDCNNLIFGEKENDKN